MVGTLALILTFSPEEKEQHSHIAGLRVIPRKSSRANFYETDNAGSTL